MAEATVGGAEDIQEVDIRHGTSDQLVDPWCDLCILGSKGKIDAVGYCPDCNTLLCRSCNEIHNTWPTFENHRIWRGSRLPKSQADKPVRYPNCKTHDSTPNDHFCFQHSKMVCSACVKQSHGTCNAMSISDICKDLGETDIKQFKAAIFDIQDNVKKAKSMLEKNVAHLEKRKKKLIKEAEVKRDSIISKAGELFEQTVSNISEICRAKKAQIENKILDLSDEILSFDEIIGNIHKSTLVATNFGRSTFIQMQRIVEKTQKCTQVIDDMLSELQILELSFATNSNVSTFLTNVKELGTIEEEVKMLDVKTVLDVKFPITLKIKLEKDIGHIQTQKMSSINVRAPCEKDICDIYGMDIDSAGRLFFVDYKNKSLKLMSKEGKLISYHSLNSVPWAVRVTDDSTVLVSTSDGKLYIFDISSYENISVGKTVSLPYSIAGIAPINSNLAVTCWKPEPRCVKLVTMEGKELWTVSADEQGQQLFEKPLSVVSNTVNGKKQLVVTDWGKDTITLLRPSNGRIMKTIDVKGKGFRGLTVDKDGNVYVCYFQSKEVCVLTPDFEKSKIILTSKDLRSGPSDIAYSNKTDEFYISYRGDIVDCFKLK